MKPIDNTTGPYMPIKDIQDDPSIRNEAILPPPNKLANYIANMKRWEKTQKINQLAKHKATCAKNKKNRKKKKR